VTRDLLRRGLCTLLRVFYRRIEVAGREHVPELGPVVFVLNHPNALIDPLVLLCRVSRPVSFLAKEPLFRMPLVGTLVRAMDSIPVYRRMDQADMAKNQATFGAARSVLARGGSIALFPEGRSHDEPRLLPFRTGAARIALGAAAEAGLKVVPASLYYSRKDIFRSSVLLCFGEPLQVDPTVPGPDGEPGQDKVRELTDRIRVALGALTLEADRHRALKLVAAAEAVITTAEDDTPTDLASRHRTRQRVLEGYRRLRQEAPEDLARLERRVTRFEATVRLAGLSPRLLPARGYRPAQVAWITLRSLLTLLLLLPVALAGMVLHAPTHFVIRFLAARWGGGGADGRASVKAVAGLVLYPATWLVLALLLWRVWHLPGALAALALSVPAGLVALHFLERVQALLGGARGVLLALTGRRRFIRLLAERRAIRDDLRVLAERLGV